MLQGFVADDIIGRFDLNQPPDGGGHDHYMEHDDAEPEFVVLQDSAASGNASNVAQNFAEEADEDICSQPVVPYVGMVFDTLEVAQQVYNDYAFKLGFGTRIGNTKFSTARGVAKHTILSRVFECVHKGKPADEGKSERIMTGVGEKGQDGTIDMSCFSAQKSRSKQAGLQMDVKDTRKKNRVQKHDCKAKMLVGMRDGLWTVTVFNEQHTHPLVQQIGRRRYYRSHRSVPEEDFQLVQTLHMQNINTAQIMGCLGGVHGGDPRCLGYVKRDISNIRTMLREEVSQREIGRAHV